MDTGFVPYLEKESLVCFTYKIGKILMEQNNPTLSWEEINKYTSSPDNSDKIALICSKTYGINITFRGVKIL